MSNEDDPVATLIEGLTELRRVTADEIDKVHGSLAGTHKAVADMDREIKQELAGLGELVRGLAADVRTALSVVPSLRKRIDILEAAVGIEEEQGHGPANGSA